MFNLENAIAAWRRQMQKAGLTHNIIDELEAHLRDELDVQIRAGSPEDQAFHTAVQLLGDASKLQDEFSKSTHADPQPKQKLLRAISFISAGILGWLGASIRAMLSRDPVDAAIPASSELKSPHLLENARAEALRLGHDFIGTEHVLLALLKEEEGANLLRPWLASYESVRAEIERIISPQPPQNIASTPALTPRARKALRIAQREARRSHQPVITAHHILSGLLLERTGLAAKILNKLRVAF